MGFKCTPQILGLTRMDTAHGNWSEKHRAPVEQICMEAGPKRVTSSVTYDPARSDMNQYYYYCDGKRSSGIDVAWDMEKRADEYEEPVHCRRKKKDESGNEIKDADGNPVMEEVTHYRKLRNDAVIGFALILNPPHEMCQGWDDATYGKFYLDSWDVLNNICPEIFRDSNIRMMAEHYDEGYPPAEGEKDFKPDRHMHIIGDCIREDGRYCGKLISPILFTKINAHYPEAMRKLGWDIDDCDMYDAKRAQTDQKYKKEYFARKKSQGLSNTDYVVRKLKQQTMEAGKMIDEYQSYLAEQSKATRRPLPEGYEKITREYDNGHVGYYQHQHDARKKDL